MEGDATTQEIPVDGRKLAIYKKTDETFAPKGPARVRGKIRNKLPAIKKGISPRVNTHTGKLM